MKKGPKFEADVIEWLRAHGFRYAERRVMGGSRDRGDVAGIPGVVLELKNCAKIEVGNFVAEAEAEARNAGCDVWAVVVKRRGKSNPGDAYVLTNLSVFAALIADPSPPVDPPLPSTPVDSRA